MMHLRVAIAAAVVAAALMGVVSEAQAGHLSPAAQGHVAVYNAAANWDGARAKIEVRAGDISLADANEGYVVSQHLLVADNSAYGTSLFVRAGIVRKQFGPELTEANIQTVFYWMTRESDGDHWHYQSELPIGYPSDNVGDQIYFRICRESSGSNGYVVRAGSGYLYDWAGVYLAQPGFTEIDYYRVGLITNATSGRYATVGNPANNIGIMRTTDYGSAWDYAAVSGAQNPTVVDSQGITDAGWTTRVESSWDYRNQ